MSGSTNDIPPQPPLDRLGAFCPHGPVAMQGAAQGPLANLTMGVKDLFDIAGHRTGFGNPNWLQSHPPATRTAPAVKRLLDAGAQMAGKTICDELCFSLNGENIHYGTPQNPNAPGRIPGGSSSGSAAAVAGGLVDFALGSDTGGSVRLPASYCGIYGIRTSHGRVASEGVAPLAPEFDVVGWFARDPQLFALIGEFLLDDHQAAAPLSQFLVLGDAFEIAGREASAALESPLAALRAKIETAGEAKTITLGQERLYQLANDFKVLQGAEIWAVHGEWIMHRQPVFESAIKDRLAWALTLTKSDVAPARSRQIEWKKQASDLFPAGCVMCVPVAPGPAPRKGRPAAELEQYRKRLMPLLCLAGLAGLAQISLPLGRLDSCPLGLGLIAGPGGDETLLALAAKFNEIPIGSL